MPFRGCISEKDAWDFVESVDLHQSCNKVAGHAILVNFESSKVRESRITNPRSCAGDLPLVCVRTRYGTNESTVLIVGLGPAFW